MKQDTFANRLIALMDEQDITIRELAEFVSISPSTLNNWRSGVQPTSYSKVKLLAKKLGVSFEFLLTGADESNATNGNSITEIFQDGGNVFEGYLEVKIKRLIPRKPITKKGD